MDLTALQNAVLGEVILPGSEAYEIARRPPMARFQDILPQAIVRCRTPSDVVAALSLVRRTGTALAVRSGGHCFAGGSSTEGILIDVSPMNAVSLADGIATVGAGARLAEIYDALSAQGVTIAGGCGPTVGIAGLVLGGGLGILGRKHGLTCDQLIGAEVVLADGRVVECDKDQHLDLFWALRGAGGGQFGVVTTLALRTVPAPSATTIDLTWPIGTAEALLDAWQGWSPSAPDELAASLLAVAGEDPAKPPTIHVFGAMLGTEADAMELIEVLVAKAGAEPATAQLVYAPYIESKRYLSEHGPGESAQGPSPAHSFSKSEFFGGVLPSDVITALLNNFTARRAPGQTRTLDFTPWGGAYNRVKPEATAFVHRAHRFLLKHDVAVDAAAAPAEHHEASDWLARSWEIVHPWGSGGVYPNFPDPDLDDAATAYYGANLERLLRVKATYDPGNLFHGSSTPVGGGEFKPGADDSASPRA